MRKYNDKNKQQLIDIFKDVSKQPLKIVKAKEIKEYESAKVMSISCANPEVAINLSNHKEKAWNYEAFNKIEKCEQEIKARKEYIDVAINIINQVGKNMSPIIIQMYLNNNKKGDVENLYGCGFTKEMLRSKVSDALDKINTESNINVLTTFAENARQYDSTAGMDSELCY